jgi:hypothetical protein
MRTKIIYSILIFFIANQMLAMEQEQSFRLMISPLLKINANKVELINRINNAQPGTFFNINDLVKHYLDNGEEIFVKQTLNDCTIKISLDRDLILSTISVDPLAGEGESWRFIGKNFVFKEMPLREFLDYFSVNNFKKQHVDSNGIPTYQTDFLSPEFIISFIEFMRDYHSFLLEEIDRMCSEGRGKLEETTNNSSKKKKRKAYSTLREKRCKEEELIEVENSKKVISFVEKASSEFIDAYLNSRHEFEIYLQKVLLSLELTLKNLKRDGLKVINTIKRQNPNQDCRENIVFKSALNIISFYYLFIEEFKDLNQALLREKRLDIGKFLKVQEDYANAISELLLEAGQKQNRNYSSRGTTRRGWGRNSRSNNVSKTMANKKVVEDRKKSKQEAAKVVFYAAGEGAEYYNADGSVENLKRYYSKNENEEPKKIRTKGEALVLEEKNSVSQKKQDKVEETRFYFSNKVKEMIALLEKKDQELSFSDYIKALVELVQSNKEFIQEASEYNRKGSHRSFKIVLKNGTKLIWTVSLFEKDRIPQNINFRKHFLTPFYFFSEKSGKKL